MTDEPDIIKELREEEKLGGLHGRSHGDYDELELPKEAVEEVSDENILVGEDDFDLKSTQYGDSPDDESIDEKELLFQGTSDLMMYLDRHGKITRINRAGLAFSGFTEEEIIGKPFWKLPGIFSKYNTPKFLKVFKNAFRGREIQGFIGELNDKSGRKHIMDFSTCCIKENKKVKYLLVIARDITEQKEIGETLLETGERYRLIAENTSDLINLAKFSLNPTYTYASPSYEGLLGYKPEEMIGKPCFDFVHPDDKKKLLSLLKKYVGAKGRKLFTGKDSDVSETIEFRVKDKSGNWHYMESTANIMGNELLFISRDVTERKQVEEMLYESKENYKTIFENLPFVAFTLDRKGRLLEGNKCAEKVLGLKIEDFKGKSFSKFGLLGKKDLLKAFIEFRKNLRGEVTDKTVYTLRQKDREEMLLELIGIPLKDKDGVARVLDVGENITERRKAEEELKESEEKLSQIVHGSPIPTFVIDNKHVITHWNKALEKITGLSSKEMSGTQKQWKAFYSKECPVLADFIVDNTTENDIATHYLGKYHKSTVIEGAYEAEDFFPHLGDDGKWLFFTATLLKNAKGDVTGAIETLQDTTERKKANDRIASSERKFRSIFENANDAMFLMSEDTFVDCNTKTEEIFGCSRKDILQRKPYEFSPPHQLDGRESKEKALEKINATFAGKPQFFEWKHSKLDGTLFNAEVSLNRIEVEGKPMIQAIVRDITKRKQIEETLRESEAQYHGIFDSATDSFLIFDIDGNIVDANPQACKMYGYPYGELIKLSGKDIVHHDYCHLFEQFKQDVQTTGEFHAESVDVHKDGTPFSIEVRGSAFNYNGKPHLLAVIRDITERKQSDDELKKKIDELERYKDVTVGRELRLIELKKKIKELEEK